MHVYTWKYTYKVDVIQILNLQSQHCHLSNDIILPHRFVTEQGYETLHAPQDLIIPTANA